MAQLNNGSYIPWIGKEEWQEANRSIEYLIARKNGCLEEAFFLAGRIEQKYKQIFPLLDRLCGQTCPECPDPCCLRATVWIDFQDLLFLHLSRQDIPAKQLLSAGRAKCRYASPQGCLLPRLSRPWICTWYICPEQKRLLEQEPLPEQRALWNSWQEIKGLRRKMEEEFILS